jgi:acyl-coenzyme A thioesterase PaaI-like protein
MKINLLAPASGDVIIAKGRVIKAGRRLTIVGADVFARTGDQEKHIAILQGTMISS